MEKIVKLWNEWTTQMFHCPYCGHEFNFSLVQWNTMIRCKHCKRVLHVRLRPKFIALMAVIGFVIYSLIYALLNQFVSSFLVIMVVLVLFLFLYTAIFSKLAVRFAGEDKVYKMSVEKKK